jgi:hypothetical protein
MTTILTILAIWVVASIPISLIVGRMLMLADTGEDRQMETVKQEQPNYSGQRELVS